MEYRRVKVALPDDVVRLLSKVPNKSAFITRAITDKLAAQKRKDSRRLELLAAYKWIAKHPEYEKDARSDW